ncbi:uncharacterized protein LOC132162828 [Corylus avellana]|uniref:uncharacterized protein LOC132162825 n=1 Tax=Corylus avellana TaxID=13451 RepID=UPI00286CADC8|nr:uncharacterized protein LOC132162825 [Corylus avellana]XP_059429031.1 uncharacterized protein LOC132162828 [Corylus avellana]
MIFEGIFLSPPVLLQKAKDQLGEFVKADQTLRAKTAQNRQPARDKWQVPDLGALKLNWDTALDTRKKRMGVGIVVRNHDGEVLLTKCMVQDHITDPTIAEAIAARASVELVRQLGFQSVIFEGDSLVVVKALSSEDRCWSQFGMLIEETKIILRSCGSWEVCHIRRAANEVAHRISKLALTLNETHVWEESVPLCIREIVMAERPL